MQGKFGSLMSWDELAWAVFEQLVACFGMKLQIALCSATTSSVIVARIAAWCLIPLAGHLHMLFVGYQLSTGARRLVAGSASAQ